MIKVIGVGGAGNNAVNRMIDEEIQNVEFWVANTDKQALSTSRTRNRLVLGEAYTHGLGAGGKPAVGRQAALASKDEIAEIVEGADLVFIAAGMGAELVQVPHQLLLSKQKSRCFNNCDCDTAIYI